MSSSNGSKATSRAAHGLQPENLRRALAAAAVAPRATESQLSIRGRPPRRLGLLASALLLGLLLACGCSSPGGVSLSPRYTPLSQPPTATDAISGGILVVADNQIHHLFGDPTFFRTRFTDARFSKTAIRPPQLDLYGQDWLSEILSKQSQRAEAVIHLGDALDFACESEWTNFLEVMRASAAPWVMAPGNHDAYFFGNFETAPRTTPRGAELSAGLVSGMWRDSCRDPSSPASIDQALRKDRFVISYLTALVRQPNAAAHGNWPFRFHPTGSGSWHCAKNTCSKGFLQQVSWNIDRDEPWRSFVVSRVNLGYCRVRATNACSEPIAPIDAIVLDTTTYRSPAGLRLDSLSRAAGELGSLSGAQRRIVQRWLGASSKARRPAILMGHHPYSDLDAPSRRLIDDAMQSTSTFYVSAHTHAGGYRVNGSPHAGWLELNVGSILDFPPQSMLLQFGRAEGRPMLAAKRQLIGPPRSAQGFACIPEWEPRPTDPDAFVSYADIGARSQFDAHAMQSHVYDTLLAALQRFFRCVTKAELAAQMGKCRNNSVHDQRIAAARQSPSLDVKARALSSLVALSEDQARYDPETWRLFRQCQAYWASKYEQFEARTPVAGDDYILLPRPPSN